MNTKVCHITSVHPAHDIRIVYKECMSLVLHGYAVHLVAQAALHSTPPGIIHHVLPVSEQESRMKRMICRGWKAYQLAKETHADIFHFHDPELLPYGLLLKWQGKRVIYDAHEDLPRDIMTKTWIPIYFRKGLSWFIKTIEHFIARRLDAVITATPFINARFEAIGAYATDIKNYPQITEFSNPKNEDKHAKINKTPVLCYVGMISKERGMIEMIQVAKTLNLRLIMAGPFINKQTEMIAHSLPGWEKVDYRGNVSRQEIQAIFTESDVGLCILHPLPTYQDSLPIKLFEYMAAGLPVLSSHFLKWKNIVESARCGLCVDPLNILEIETAITSLIQNKSQAKAMGHQGREAIKTHYSWDAERKRLINIYQHILPQKENTF